MPPSAIRDFFDVNHAIHNLGFNVIDPELLNLLSRKIQEQGVSMYLKTN